MLKPVKPLGGKPSIKLVNPAERVTVPVKSNSSKSNKPAKNSGQRKAQGFTEKFTDVIDKKEMALNDTSKLVFSFLKNTSEEGDYHVDIRKHMYIEDDTGVKRWTPTKKGFMFNAEMFEEFINVLNAMNEEAQEQGV